jgi:LmbE family N-acetylglucosaminyl deacetylase
MVVLAHPDDESFGLGGTLALYTKQNISVHLVCATRGEAGEINENLMKGFNSIEERRVFELKCAAKRLNLTTIDFLGYRDSGMQNSADNNHPQALCRAGVGEVAKKISHLMNIYKPQVVITFDPNGGYFHPDHIAIHHATVKSFFHLLNTNKNNTYYPKKLYFHLMPMGSIRFLLKLFPLLGLNPRRFGKNKDIDLVEIANHSFPIHARINYRSVSGLKKQAIACYVSQMNEHASHLLFRIVDQIINVNDYYMRAYPEPVKGKIESDLFAGLS